MGMQGDFLQLLKEQGYTLGVSTAVGAGQALTNATTILAFKYRDGIRKCLASPHRRRYAQCIALFLQQLKKIPLHPHFFTLVLSRKF